MNKILTTLIGTSLLTGALYAGQHTSMKNTKGCSAHSQCKFSMKSDKESTTTKTGIDLFFEQYTQNDPNGGG